MIRIKFFLMSPDETKSKTGPNTNLEFISRIFIGDEHGIAMHLQSGDCPEMAHALLDNLVQGVSLVLTRNQHHHLKRFIANSLSVSQFNFSKLLNALCVPRDFVKARMTETFQ